MARPALGTGTPGRHDLVLPLTAIAKKKKMEKKMEKKILGMGGTGHFQPCPCEAGGRNHEDRVAGPDRVCSNPASSGVCLLISAAEGHRSLTQRGSLDSGEDCPSSPPSSALLTGRALGNFSTLSLKASVCPSAKWPSQGQLGNRVSVRAEHVINVRM